MASIQSYILRFIIRKTINWNQPLDKVRAMLDKTSPKEKIPSDISIKKVIVDEVLSEWFIPDGVACDKTIVYLHGGGYCIGVSNTNRNFAAKIACDSGIPVILLHYKLAPENPFPAAISDSIALYYWLIEKAGLQPGKIALLADSSGCGLCLSMLLKIREESTPLPACLAFMTPVVDLSHKGSSYFNQKKNDPFNISEEFFIDRIYVGNNNPADQKFSPVYADLTGMPETLIQGAEFDIFSSDSEKLFSVLKEVGTPVSMKIWPKMWHIFQFSEVFLPEGRRAMNEIHCFIERKISKN